MYSRNMRAMALTIAVSFLNLTFGSVAFAAESGAGVLPTAAIPSGATTSNYSYQASDPNYEMRRAEEERTRQVQIRAEAEARKAEADRKSDEAKQRRQELREANAETKVSCLQSHGRYYTMTSEYGPLGMCDTTPHGWQAKHTIAAVSVGGVLATLTSIVLYGFYSDAKKNEWNNQ